VRSSSSSRLASFSRSARFFGFPIAVWLKTVCIYVADEELFFSPTAGAGKSGCLVSLSLGMGRVLLFRVLAYWCGTNKTFRQDLALHEVG